MSKMNSKFKYMFDAAPSIALLTKDGVAKTASFNGPAIVLDNVEGYWNTTELADKTLAIVLHVTDIDKSARTATMTFASVVSTDTFELNDGVNTATFVAATDFPVGGTNAETASNAADAINEVYDDGDIAISAVAVGAVITLTNHLGTGGSITEAETTITTTAFAGGNETYSVELEAGPVGFASSIKTGQLTLTETGQYLILVDIDTIRKMKSDAAAIRLAFTLAGVAPSVTSHSWITGIQK